jgi:hypothetical protein
MRERDKIKNSSLNVPNHLLLLGSLLLSEESPLFQRLNILQQYEEAYSLHNPNYK